MAASKPFLSSPWSPEGAGTQLPALLSPSLLGPAATGYRWLRNETKRGSFHWTWNWCKDQSRSEKNTTWKRTVQGIKQIFFSPYLVVQMQSEASSHWSQYPTWQEPGFHLQCFNLWFMSEQLHSSHFFPPLIPHYFHSQGTLLFNSIQSFLGVRWTFGVLSSAFIRLVISKNYISV